MEKALTAAGLLETHIQLGQLGHTVDQLGYFCSEAGSQLIKCHVTVFHHVVEQRGHNGINVQTEVDKEKGGL